MGREPNLVVSRPCFKSTMNSYLHACARENPRAARSGPAEAEAGIASCSWISASVTSSLTRKRRNVSICSVGAQTGFGSLHPVTHRF